MEVKIMTTTESEIRSLILQFLHDDIPHSQKKIKSFCADRLNCSKKEISSLVDGVINQLIAENSIVRESSGKIRIVSNLPSDSDVRKSILDLFRDRNACHLKEIRKFCANQFSISRSLMDNCIDEILRSLIGEGKIERFNGEFYRLTEKSKITLPNQSTLTNWIQLILSDGREHSLEDIQKLCLKNFSLYQNIDDEDNRIQFYSKIFEVIQNLISANEIESPRHSIFKRVATSNEEFPNSEALETKIMEFLGDNQPRHASEIQKFCSEQFSIPDSKDGSLFKNLILATLNSLSKSGAIKIQDNGFYVINSTDDLLELTTKFEFPNQSEIAKLVRKLLSDGKDHSLNSIRDFCAHELKIPDEALKIRYESNGKLKFAELVWSTIFHMKKRGEIMKSGQSTYRIVSESDLPNQSQLIAAIRECLGDCLEHQMKDIVEFCRNKFNLTIEILNLTYDNDRKSPQFYGKVSAALTQMRRMNELDDNVRRGFHKLKSPIQKSVTDQKIVIEAQTLDRFDQAFIDAIREGNFEISDIKNACRKKLGISRAKKSLEEFSKRMDKSRRKLQNLGLIEKVPNTRGKYRLVETLKTQPILIPPKSKKSTSEDRTIQTVIDNISSNGKFLSASEIRAHVENELSMDKTKILNKIKYLKWEY